MSAPQAGSITALLDRQRAGDGAARDQLLLRLAFQMHPVACRLMGQEPAGHTLQPTALVNEAVTRLITQDAMAAAPNRAYLFGAAARAMWQVLVDHARAEESERRGAGMTQVPLSEELPADERRSPFGLVEFHDAVAALGRVSERAADVVMLRYLGGCTMPEVASMLGVALSTAEADWRFARAWLFRAVGGGKKSEFGQGE